MAKNITPMEKDYSKWYTDIVLKAELADYSPVKGCMVIRPNGFAIWEKMREILDGMFKETGHKNAYFPLLIPKSFLSKEAEHVQGFAKECAVVTHHRLREAAGGGVEVDPDAELEEPLVIRPTSETIIWSMYRKWIMSYRDLPLLLNQWANIVRWEMRTRLFLRTTEFLWQEGHTAHATEKEAGEEAIRMLEVYRTFVEEYMAIPVLTGAKSESERFAGAVETYCIEAMMQDGKALQGGTSHDLGQNFARAFDVTFQDENGDRQHVWATSWGVSTRLIGAMIMVHGDNRGLVVPPRLAATQAVIIPIWYNDEEKETVLSYLEKEVKPVIPDSVEYVVDDRDQFKAGWKFNEWEQRGVPLRIEVGPRDAKNRKAVLVYRYDGSKHFIEIEKLGEAIGTGLEDIQAGMFEKAKTFMNARTRDEDSYPNFRKLIESEGGFYRMHWCGSGTCEEQVKEETKATIRCIPLDGHGDEGECVICGKPSKTRVVFARSY